VPKHSFAKVRYAVFGCGNSDWAATYQSIPRFIDEQLGGAWRPRRVYPRRGRCPVVTSMASSKAVRQACATGDKEFGIDSELQPQRPTTSRSTRSTRWRPQW